MTMACIWLKLSNSSQNMLLIFDTVTKSYKLFITNQLHVQ